MRRRSPFLAAAAIALFATACAGGVNESDPAALETTQLVDEFETLEGTTIDLASLQGDDVVLWFWAPW